MSNGGYKGASPARETSPEQYPGVWELTEQFQAQADGNWPFQETDCAPKSLRFDSSAGAKLSKTFLAAGNRRTWTWSGWVKRGKLSGDNQPFLTANSSSGNSFFMGWHGYYNDAREDAIEINNVAGTGDGYITTAVFRDPSAWYSVVISFDSTAPSDRIKCWVNGVKQTWQQTTNGPGLNDQWKVNDTIAHTIGGTANSFTGQGNLDSCLAEVQFIDGQALTPDAFTFIDGQGILQPKRFTGDYSSGPVYSASSDANGVVSGSGNLSLLFDGNTGTSVVLSQSSSDYAIATQGQSIPVTSTIGMWTTTGASNPTMRVTETDGTVTVLDHNDATIQNNNWTDFSFTGTVAKIELGYIAGSGSSNGFFALRTDGNTLIDASIGRNSFHLDFSDGAKDQSGLGNDWTATNIGLAGGNVDRTSELSENHASGSVALPYRAFNATYISSKINTSTWAVTTTAWDGAYSAAYAEFRWIPTGGYAVSNSLRVYYGCYDNTAKTTTLTITYTDGSTETDSMTSGSNNWMKLFTASNAAGKTVQKVELSPSTPSATNLQFGGFVIDNAIVESSNPDSDFCVDSPVNGNEASTGAGGERRGCYCTMNPLKNRLALSDGNLKVTGTSGWMGSTGTIGMSSGKYYWEYGNVVSNEHIIGIVKESFTNPTSIVGTNDAYGYGSETGGLYDPVGGSNQSYGASWTTGDTIGIAFDADAGTLTFYKNGTSQGTAFTGLTDGPYLPSVVQNGSSRSAILNFGQKPFKYRNAGTDRPSADYKPVSTSFLPEPSESAKNPHKGVDVGLFNANNGVARFIPFSFSPDLVWTKSRDQNYEPQIFDKVRGDNQEMSTNVARASRNLADSGTFNDDGFTLPGSNNNANYGTGPGVALAWDAGEATTSIAAGSLNTSAYNTSQHWSANHASGNTAPTQAFDGTGPKQNGYAHTSGSLTLTFNPALSGRFIVYGGSGGGGADDYTISDGTTSTTLSSNQSYASAPYFEALDFGEQTGITTLTCSPGYTLYGIRVAGKLLVDSNVTPPNVPSIATTVRANPSYGFSISKASVAASLSGGPTVAHGLQKKPEFIMGKNIDSTIYWYAYHKDLTNNHYLIPHLTSGEQNSGAVWGSHASLDENKFQIGSGTPASMWIPSGTHDCIFFAWTSIEGFSKFGSYINPSSTDGAFVFCGFKPRLIMAKCAKNISSSNSTGDWIVKDSSRSPYNNPSDGNTLVWNEEEAEDNYYSAGQAAIDILSNGFKIRHPNSSPAGDPGRLYIYAAWAQNPFASNNRAG